MSDLDPPPIVGIILLMLIAFALGLFIAWVL